MALNTPLDIISLALKGSGVLGVGNSPLSEDTNDAFDVLNTILVEYQIQRWLVYDLTDVAVNSTGAASYTVGPTGSFVFTGQRPDTVGAVFVRLIATGVDTYLYPFMSREGFDRVASKSATGIPESFYYDPTMSGNGVLYVYPIPASTYSIHVQAKADLSQFTSLTQTITLPAIYKAALLWNLTEALRPLYQLPPDPQVSARAASTKQAMIQSIAQVPTVTVPQQSSRSGIFAGATVNIQGGA